MGLNYNPASVTQGLVYYLDLTNSRCYSGSGNTLTNLANGAIGITIVSGITYDTDYRKNLNFNGSSGYMTGNDTNLNFSTSDFTIQTTLKLNGLSNGFTGGYGSMICAGTALTNNSSIFRFSGTATSHYALALWHQPTSTAIERNFNFQTNKIYNLAVTKRFNVVEFFVDGTSIGTTTSSNNFNFTANGFAIGRWYYPGYEQYLKGSIFDFRAYNRALSIDEIQQNYFSQTKRYYNEENIVTDGLILNIDPSKSTSYSGLGNTIYDLSGFGISGTLTNGPGFSGLNGGSIVFDGSNDHIVLDNYYLTRTNSSYKYTIIAAGKLATTSTGVRQLISSDAGGYGWSLGAWNNKYFIFTGNGITAAGSQDLNWHIFAAQWGPDGSKLFLDNTLIVSGSVSYGSNVNQTFIGNNPIGYNERWNGNVGIILIYNRILSTNELTQNFNALRSRFGI